MRAKTVGLVFLGTSGWYAGQFLFSPYVKNQTHIRQFQPVYGDNRTTGIHHVSYYEEEKDHTMSLLAWPVTVPYFYLTEKD